jgi:hypothetical protein
LIDGFWTGPGWKFVNFQEEDHGPIYPKCELSDGYVRVICALPMIVPLVYFLATLILVLKMRNFPHNFRETLNILTATLIVAFCSVMFLSGYSVSPPETRALLRAVVVYMTSLAFLLCLFLPKAIVLLQKNADMTEERRMITESLQVFASKIQGSRSPTLSLVSNASSVYSRNNSRINSQASSPGLGCRPSLILSSADMTEERRMINESLQVFASKIQGSRSPTLSLVSNASSVYSRNNSRINSQASSPGLGCRPSLILSSPYASRINKRG